IQFDAGFISAPRSIDSAVDGDRFAAVLRRAYIGAQGTIPGGFSYRAEIDLAPKTPEWADLYIAYDKGPFNVTVGQIYPFLGIEQMSSDLFPSFTERAAFTGAFNYRRRVGLALGYSRKTWMVNAGVFGDSVADVLPDGSRSVGFDGRAVWMPKIEDIQFHVAASAHIRHYFDYPTPNAVRYRSRPYFFSTALRPIETDTVNVQDERNYGAELAAIRRRIHVVGEFSAFQSVRANNIQPTYIGGYAEIGLFLTPDTRSYKAGQFDRTVPTHPIGKGIGAIEINARYDYLDLTDNSSIFAGRQQSLGGSLVWTPLPYVRFIANYVHNNFYYRGFPPDAAVDTATARAQVDLAHSNLDDRQVRAPQAGRVDKVYFDAGEVAATGVPVVALLPPGDLTALFFVPESERADLQSGDVVQVSCDGCPIDLTAKITRMASDPQYTPPILYTREQRGRLVYRVEADVIEPKGVLPGQPITVDAALAVGK
ncbi:MAG: HlyD family efflux transporter periplasmic adaptor subunit, partial [Alphaproteobacteria bacterium]|nr:HlyD family efflux transporter periplasmic adaptor subunit [Alphaproteobacteria bacterium]